MGLVQQVLEMSERDYLPLMSEVHGTYKIVHGIALVVIGNVGLHQVGILKVCHLEKDEGQISDHAGRILSGYRLIRQGVDVNFAFISLIAACALFNQVYP